MTDPHDPTLDAVDRAARAASDGLHAHVHRHVEPELMLASLPPGPPATAPAATSGLVSRWTRTATSSRTPNPAC